MELYKKYRPKSIAAVVGQTAAMASLQKLMDRGLPHVILLTGPSGTGKTTIARILKRHLKCGNPDYQEIDCAIVESPLDEVRRIRRVSNLCPMAGDVRIWFLEEAQSLSRAGFSQQAMLKLLEDVSDSVYFILATTDAQKLHRAIHTRCTEIKLAALGVPVLEELVRSVAAQEKLKVSDETVAEIVEAADGSARKALVILEQVGSLSAEDQLKAVQVSSLNKDKAFALARAIMGWDRGATWATVAKMLRDLEDEDAEGIRYLVLACARTAMIGKGDKPASPQQAAIGFKVIDIFSENFYDSKHAGLAWACYAVMNQR
jgi:DNA polymerase III gamma/tau subunit